MWQQLGHQEWTHLWQQQQQQHPFDDILHLQQKHQQLVQEYQKLRWD